MLIVSCCQFISYITWPIPLRAWECHVSSFKLLGFTFTYAGNVKWNMPDLSGKITFREMFGRWCQTRRNSFTFSCKQCFHICKEYEMNHTGSLSYYHISGNVQKMISGVVDYFLFQLINTLSPLFFHTTFSNAFSWMKMYQFRLRFHWNLFLRVQLTISQHWFR